MISKTIVVIGASRGIGLELVKQFAATSAHQVIALARNLAEMENQFAGFSNVKCFAIDLKKSTVKEDLASISESFSQVDILINNAGYLVNKPFASITHEDLVDSYQVNVISAIESVQAILPKMKAGAHIVNISSMGGFQGSAKFQGLTAYSTSKAALCSFTELFAEEFKETGIKMNCLCLGAVQTEMLEEAFPGYVAPMNAEKMANYIVHFALTAQEWMNGKIIPVSLSTP